MLKKQTRNICLIMNLRKFEFFLVAHLPLSIFVSSVFDNKVTRSIQFYLLFNDHKNVNNKYKNQQFYKICYLHTLSLTLLLTVFGLLRYALQYQYFVLEHLIESYTISIIT